MQVTEAMVCAAANKLPPYSHWTDADVRNALVAALETANEPKPKITIISYHGDAIYLGDVLIHDGYGDRYSCAYRVLQALGYEVERRNVDCHNEMPRSAGDLHRPQPPKSLHELNAHLLNLKRQRRRDQIKGMRDTLKRLEMEELKDNMDVALTKER